jgi:hypothetical protein
LFEADFQQGKSGPAEFPMTLAGVGKNAQSVATAGKVQDQGHDRDIEFKNITVGMIQGRKCTIVPGSFAECLIDLLRAELARFAAEHQIVLLGNPADISGRNTENLSHLTVLPRAAEMEHNIAQIKIDKLWCGHFGYAFRCSGQLIRPIPLGYDHGL